MMITSSTSLPTRLLLSALSGMGAATICHPLDVVRVHLQTTNNNNPNFYRNSWHAAQSIYKNHGVGQGLYAGLSAAYLRQVLYGSCRMGIYSWLLELQKQQGDTISFATKMVMGCVSGGIGSFCGTPAEVALVRMGSDSKLPPAERQNYTSVLDCWARIVREDGWAHLWRGAAPTVLRATVLSSTLLSVTSETKDFLITSGYFGPQGQWGQGLPLLICATTVASFCATVASNPLDVIKTRMQQHKQLQKKHQTTGAVPKAPQHTSPSMLSCLQTSLQREGWTVLYKGFVPSFLKMTPYAILSLTLLEKLTQFWTGRDAL
mmetsp:Transcript_3258/g.9139  ORF Transcript_3258/g.9139 Transcript_3258/m.9139 type:complete len:319 (-) Transcript_3258:326-1282(-)